MAATRLNEEAVGGGMALLQIYCLFVQNQVKARGSGARRHNKHDHQLLLYKSRRAKVKVERWAASGAGCKGKVRLMGRSQMKTGRKALLYSGLFVALNQSAMKEGNTVFLD